MKYKFKYTDRLINRIKLAEENGAPFAADILKEMRGTTGPKHTLYDLEPSGSQNSQAAPVRYVAYSSEGPFGRLKKRILNGCMFLTEVVPAVSSRMCLKDKDAFTSILDFSEKITVKETKSFPDMLSALTTWNRGRLYGSRDTNYMGQPEDARVGEGWVTFLKNCCNASMVRITTPSDTPVAAAIVWRGVDLTIGTTSVKDATILDVLYFSNSAGKSMLCKYAEDRGWYFSPLPYTLALTDSQGTSMEVVSYTMPVRLSRIPGQLYFGCLFKELRLKDGQFILASPAVSSNLNPPDNGSLVGDCYMDNRVVKLKADICPFCGKTVTPGSVCSHDTEPKVAFNFIMDRVVRIGGKLYPKSVTDHGRLKDTYKLHRQLKAWSKKG